MNRNKDKTSAKTHPYTLSRVEGQDHDFLMQNTTPCLPAEPPSHTMAPAHTFRVKIVQESFSKARRHQGQVALALLHPPPAQLGMEPSCAAAQQGKEEGCSTPGQLLVLPDNLTLLPSSTGTLQTPRFQSTHPKPTLSLPFLPQREQHSAMHREGAGSISADSSK